MNRAERILFVKVVFERFTPQVIEVERIIEPGQSLFRIKPYDVMPERTTTCVIDVEVEPDRIENLLPRNRRGILYGGVFGIDADDLRVGMGVQIENRAESGIEVISNDEVVGVSAGSEPPVFVQEGTFV